VKPEKCDYWTAVSCLRTRSKIDSREQGYEPQIPLNVGASVTRQSTLGTLGNVHHAKN